MNETATSVKREFPLGRAIDNLLARQLLCAIASVNDRSDPPVAHINVAYFVPITRHSLLIWSSDRSDHAALWEVNQSVSVSICDSHQAWGTPHAGLQGFGKAAPAAGSVISSAGGLYTRRFPGFKGTTWTDSYRFYTLEIDLWKCVDELELGAEPQTLHSSYQ